MIFAIPRVRKSQITILPSLQPTANSVPLLLNVHVTAIDIQSNAPSNSYFISVSKLFLNKVQIKMKINIKYVNKPQGSFGQMILYKKRVLCKLSIIKLTQYMSIPSKSRFIFQNKKCS